MAAPKITQLRIWMKTRGLDAYLVPHADRYQGEFMAPGEERLMWLTGFSGSAGMAIICMDMAALFTDGRYLLQVPQQVDTRVFDIVESPPAHPASWLAAHTGKGARIGADPWLFTVSQARIWQKKADEHGWVMQWIAENPIDALWQDRPGPAKDPAHLHGNKYSGKNKDVKIAAVLDKKAAEAERIFIADPGLVCWLLNIRGRDVKHNPFLHVQALIDADGHVTLFTDPQKLSNKLRASFGNSLTVLPFAALFSELQHGKAPVQLDPMQCPLAVHDFCMRQKIQVIEAEDPAILLRAVKNPVEVRGSEDAHQKDKKAFKAFTTWFAKRNFKRKGVTELDIVKKLHDCRARDPDFIDDSFATTAGFGPNGAVVHYCADEASNLRLKPGNLLLLDSGAQYFCGTTDVTRTLAVGKPTREMKQHYTAVLRGLIALSTTRFPAGATGAQLDTIARRSIWELGLDYAHGTGHGVGSFLGVHEGPARIAPVGGHVVLLPGMILSIEPGIYLEGQYGIRLENLVVVVKDKRPGDKKPMRAFRTLTKIPFDATLIDWPVLSESERLFLAGFGTKP